MPYPLDDTIAAIASPPGGAGRGILRLSGPDVLGCVGPLFRARDGVRLSAVTRPTAKPGSLTLPGMTSRLPCELYLWPTGRSYTGQPVVEIHTIGSTPLLEATLTALCTAGARLAEPGEFTLRAFLAGRIDLSQAEAVLGVIDAADPQQLEVALAQLAGGLAGPLHKLRDDLLELLALLEAGFDFADEDLPFITPRQLNEQLNEAAGEVAALTQQMASRGLATDLARVVLVGLPNTGKSSLFNALTGNADALVWEQPGTTRDYLTAELDLDGARCLLIDTAGVGNGPDEAIAEVPRAAQAISAQQRREARVQLFCIDVTRPLGNWERARLAANTSGRLVVLTKTDLPPRTDFAQRAIRTSSLTGEGIGELRSHVRQALLAAEVHHAGVVPGTAVRCRQSLRLAAECLRRAREVSQAAYGEELIAAEIRTALEELGKVVGAVYTDDVLDRIFSRFCIGK